MRERPARAERRDGLARTVSPSLIIVFGLGTTLGAGIYVLIGEIIGVAGYWTPLAFLASSLVAGLTGASFAELSRRCPSSGGPVAWVFEAFGSRGLAVAIGWGVIAAGIVSAATVATGFVAYAGVFVDWSKWAILPVLIGVPTLIAIAGVKQSAWFMGLTTAAGIAGLAIVLWQAGGNALDWPALVAGSSGSAALPGATGGVLWGVLSGAFLAFYAFIGFEDIVHLGEEARDAETAIPRAIFVTLGIALVFYVAIAATAVATITPGQLAASPTPLVAVVEATGMNGAALAILSLVTIADGLLAQTIMASRTIYDLGKRRGGAPAGLARLSRRTRTPVVATLFCSAIILVLALFFPTKTLASGTSLIVLAVFAIANLALIMLKRRGDPPGRGFRAPVWIPYLGAASCALLACAALLTG